MKLKTKKQNRLIHINYIIPPTAYNAYSLIKNKNGSLLKKITVADIGKGQAEFDKNELRLGCYTYTLWINDIPTESKQLKIV